MIIELQHQNGKVERFDIQIADPLRTPYWLIRNGTVWSLTAEAYGPFPALYRQSQKLFDITKHTPNPKDQNS